MNFENYTLVVPDYEDDDTSDVGIISRRLTATERLQLAVWMVEGLNNREILAISSHYGFPNLTKDALDYYRYRRRDMLEEARVFLRNNALLVGLAEKSNRIRALTEHAQQLKAKIEESGLEEIETRTTGYGKSAQTVEQRRFAAALSREYRETIKQIQSETEGLERALSVSETNTTVNIFASMTEADQRQLLAALAWTPTAVPEVIIEDKEGNVTRAPLLGLPSPE